MVNSKKIDSFIDVPEHLDLEHLRAGPRNPDEKLMESNEPELKPDESVISTLVGMDFGKNRAIRAWYHTQGKGVEAAMDWVFAHMDDADIDSPFVIPKKGGGGTGSTSKVNINMETVETIMSMGYSKAWVIEALNNTNGDPDRAVDWIFSHPEPEEQSGLQVPETKENVNDNAPGRFSLFAIVTHMGSSTISGHYVAHIKCGEKWVLFDDSKVFESQDPPTKMAYLYLYRRD